MSRKVKQYLVVFKSWSQWAETDQAWRMLSRKGGEDLESDLVGDDVPRFVKIKGRTVASDEISGLQPIYELPRPTPEPVQKPMTAEQRKAHEKRMAKFREEFGIGKGGEDKQ